MPLPASCVFYPVTSCCMSAAIAAMLLVLFHSVLHINFIAVLTWLCIHCTTLSIIVALSIPPLLNVVVRIHAVFRKVKPQGTGVVWSCTLYSTPNYNSKIIINCLYIYCYKCSLTLINKNKIVWGGRRAVFFFGDQEGVSFCWWFQSGCVLFTDVWENMMHTPKRMFARMLIICTN